VRRTALLRAAVAPLLATAIGGAALGIGGPVLLAPRAEAAPATATSGPGDDVADEERPVRIEVGRFEPRTVTAGAQVTVTGTLTNTGTEPIDHLSVRLQRGDVRTTRDELAAEARDRDPATTVVPPFKQLRGSLAPGAEVEFTYSVASDQLRLDQDGVYPALLNVNGMTDSDGGGPEQRRVGELSTYLVRQPAAVTARTAVAWLWPLTERTHRNAAGEFVDDDLTDAISDDGRLDRALAVVERIPGSRGSRNGASEPGVTVTLAIDPALVEELTVMAAGSYAVDGVDGAGRGTDAAAAFLDRLAAVAAVHPVVALPYGDVDVDALQAARLGDVVVRSLPGTAKGTAEQPPASGDGDGDAGGGDGDAGVSPAPADGSGASPGPTDGDDSSAGARILARALDVQPITDLAWPAGGALRADSLATLQAGGIQRIVAGSGGLTGGPAAVGLTGSTAGAHTSVATANGPLATLVADGTLSAVVGSAERTAGGPRMAEQRYLAELAVLTLQARPGSVQTVLVAPPRGIQAGPEGAGAMIADTAALPWLSPTTVAALTTVAARPGGALVPPPAATALAPSGMADVAAAVAVRNDLAGAVVGDAASALAGSDAAIARTASVAWRADPKAFAAAAKGLRSSVERLRSRVTLVAPADGTYSLASSDAPLVLTVRNDLPVAVEVLLDISARGLSISDVGVQTLAPGERTTLQVPTKVRQSGGFVVSAQLTTPGHEPLGDRIQLKVKSTAYGSISLLITLGSAVLLGLLFLRRLVNLVLRRRRAAAGAGSPEGAAGPLPPNRSPV
jgi:hypothetical protein